MKEKSSSFKPYALFNRLREVCFCYRSLFCSVLMSHCIFQKESVLLQHMKIVTLRADMNSMYLVSVFPLSSLALSTKYCKWRSSENKCSLSQQNDKQESMHRQYLWLRCSLVTGNMWSYKANKSLYLFVPIFKLPYSLPKIHLSTKVHTIFQTITTASCNVTKSTAQKKHTNF